MENQLSSISKVTVSILRISKEQHFRFQKPVVNKTRHEIKVNEMKFKRILLTSDSKFCQQLRRDELVSIMETKHMKQINQQQNLCSICKDIRNSPKYFYSGSNESYLAPKLNNESCGLKSSDINFTIIMY